MGYVTGCVMAVPTARKDEFLEHCAACADVLKENGALEIFECWGDEVPDGEVTSFPMAVKCETDETVVFSWILWPSKQACETGMQVMMEHPSLKPEVLPMPFDGQRMIYGGFEVISEIR
ncbi:DUF1428 domain-containing protein [Nisaea sediminum]|uniref:DUF1428 domain-containing protein n=1 Tax=Nisaea sediminum TaxID=2775867 RepID=UPI001867BFDA|nr:DUF1428 family protein [Nisaea sediminum]